MKVVTLVGARPQFIKASMVSRAFAEEGVEEIIVHSGQHYDKQVSQIFFDELGIPKPMVNLKVGSGSHAVQTGQVMERFESFLNGLKQVDWVLVYGDTNTTLAGALVAAKLNIPIAHVEAGLRSFNRKMPEEINRVVTDHLSEALFCPTETAITNLDSEGISNGIYFSGDVMYDATLHFSQLAEGKTSEQKLSSAELSVLDAAGYYLATIHRASNTDDKHKLREILLGLSKLSLPVILPLHPRTKAKLEGESIPGNIEICEPVGYLQMLRLVKNAKAVVTDSGGLQKEAFWLQKPCVTVRGETEWIETLNDGWNQLVDADQDAIFSAVQNIPAENAGQKMFGLPLEGGTASTYIARKLIEKNQ